MTEKQQVIATMDRVSLPDIKAQREAIEQLQSIMLQQPQVEIPTQQLIHAGMYARAATAKAGTLLIGQIYKFDHIEVMVKGAAVVTTDNGQSVTLEGFNILPAMTGKKRAVYILEDTTWVTFHVVGDTGSMSGDQVQDMITAESFDELDNFYAEVNRADYFAFLKSVGITEDQVRAESDNESDYDGSLDLKIFDLSIGCSKIEGKGLFALKSFEVGDLIMPARINGKRTQAGRFINHAVRPNSGFAFNGGDLYCVALKPVSNGEEITVNYRDTMALRHERGDL